MYRFKVCLVAALNLVAFTSGQDFSFNQQQATGEPLVSSFFGVPSNATYDYVVVGGGTAGLTIATRLAESNCSVAVLEAGGFYEIENSDLSVIPGYASFYSGVSQSDYQPLVDWGINTTPQPGSADRSLHYARGKTLGGSSARHYHLYHRPTVGSHQQWADEVGDESYLWENMLPYYKKSVNATPPNYEAFSNATLLYDESAFEPQGGPLQVSFSNAVDPFGTYAGEAFARAGMQQIAGLSSGYLLGGAYTPSTIDPLAAQRSSSESSFLRTALNKRKAPTVYSHTLGTRIMMNGTTTMGVHVMAAGTFGTPSLNFTLQARNEVIVSAGTFQSPQLLMVSGIGDCDELVEHNISCNVPLPGVGKNIFDWREQRNAHSRTIDLYLETGAGPLSIFGGGYFAWEKLGEPYRGRLSGSTREALSQIPADWPEVEWLPLAAYSGDSANFQRADPLDGRNYATLSAGLVHPFSRGTVGLNSAHMWDLPRVDPAWLTALEDREMMLQLFHRQREIWDIFVDLGVAEAEEAFPGSQVQTDEEIMEWIGNSMACIYHAAATCKMGASSDPMAVIDGDARVYGTQRLRVVDASAMPFLTPGHPQSVVYALAGKIAAGIIDQQG